MQLSDKIEQDHLHHAYVVEAKREEGIAMIRELILGFGIATTGNPDFHEYVFDVFLLEHAHQLRREQSFHGAEGAKKIFIVAFNTILSEAQNALLKTLEEPTEGTHFFFITRTSKMFLPTLLSRMQMIRSQSLVTSRPSLEDSGKKFLAATVSERMAMVGEWTKVKPEEKPKAKEDVRRFLESLERALYQKILSMKFDEPQGSAFNPDAQGRTLVDTGVSRSLEHILFAKHALSERSPSLKLLLEHLALTIPQISHPSSVSSP